MPPLAVSRLLIAACFLSCSTAAWAQAVATAQIFGSITDPSGSPIPGAKVSVTQTETGLNRSVQSSSSGDYLLPELPIGPYRLEVSAKGFGSYIQTGITLQVSDSPKVNITLRLGQITQQVEVSADASMVKTDTTAVSQVIDKARIVDLPLNGRQPTQLIMLSGAANDIGPANGQTDLVTSKNYFSSDSISVAGGQANGTNYLLDGGENMDVFSNVNLPLPFPDALQEFSVETSALSAKYGMHAGAVVSSVTQSGTNQFHGDLFEFVRNGYCRCPRLLRVCARHFEAQSVRWDSGRSHLERQTVRVLRVSGNANSYRSPFDYLVHAYPGGSRAATSASSSRQTARAAAPLAH